MQSIPYGFELAFIVLALILIVSFGFWRTWQSEHDSVLQEWENEQKAKEGKFQERDWNSPSPPRKIFRAKLVFLASALLAVGMLLAR